MGLVRQRGQDNKLKRHESTPAQWRHGTFQLGATRRTTPKSVLAEACTVKRLWPNKPRVPPEEQRRFGEISVCGGYDPVSSIKGTANCGSELSHHPILSLLCMIDLLLDHLAF